MALAITVEVLPSWVVRLTATGSTGAVDWYRDVNGRSEWIGAGASMVDRTAPLNASLIYAAVDDVTTGVAGAVTVQSSRPVLSSSYYGSALEVTVIRQRPQGWSGQSVWHPIIDREDGPIVTIFEANLRDGQIALDAPDHAARVDLLTMLRKGDPLILRSTCHTAVDDLTILPTRWEDPLKNPDGPQDGPRSVVIDYQAVSDLPAAWSPPASWTYQAVLDAHATYDDVLTAYPTYDALLSGIPRMIAAAPELIAAVAAHHAPRWTITTSGGLDLKPLALSGSIVKSASAEHRTTIRLDTATRGRPGLLDQRMLPLGQRLRVGWGVHPLAPAITVADCPITTAGLERPASDWTHEALEPSALIAGDELDELLWTTTPSTVAELIRAIVLRTLPGTPFDITGPALTAPVETDMKIEGDPWKVCLDASRAAQSECWFRPDGTCVVRPEPALGAPVDVLAVGPGGTITGYTIDHERAYSAVYLEYHDDELDAVKFIGRWYDARPDSPISVARIGRVVYREVADDCLCDSQAQADDAAAALAARAAGRARRATVRHVPRPWLEPGDTVQVTFSGGPTEPHVVESVEIPIGPGVQVTTLRNHSYKIEEEAA